MERLMVEVAARVAPEGAVVALAARVQREDQALVAALAARVVREEQVMEVAMALQEVPQSRRMGPCPQLPHWPGRNSAHPPQTLWVSRHLPLSCLRARPGWWILSLGAKKLHVHLPLQAEPHAAHVVVRQCIWTCGGPWAGVLRQWQEWSRWQPLERARAVVYSRAQSHHRSTH